MGVGGFGIKAYEAWNLAEPFVTGKADHLDKIVSDIPGSLKNVEIPTANEYFRDADQIFAEGLKQYEQWKVDNTSLPDLFYDQPENYISVAGVWKSYMQQLRVSERELGGVDIISTLLDYLYDVGRQYDLPYSSFLASSGKTIDGIESLIVFDAGTGLVAKLRNKFSERFGRDNDLFNVASGNQFTSEQKQYLNDEVHEWFSDALLYARSIAQSKRDKISTSVLFAYFLHRNSGNILASTWDTVAWLKVAARNDPSDLKFSPNPDKASMLMSIFKDEFSPHISANWVIDNVDQHDGTLNYLGDHYALPNLKDFMPPNRAGGLYHSWNIMALALCMAPALAKRLTASQIDPFVEITPEVWTEYGREKTMADMLTAERLNEVSALAQKYLRNLPQAKIKAPR